MMERFTKNRLLATLLGSVAALLVFASLAVAETDRTGYKAAVEPICKKNKQASDRLLKPVKNLVKKDKLKPAGVAFAKAATALRKGPEGTGRGRTARRRHGPPVQVAEGNQG